MFRDVDKENETGTTAAKGLLVNVELASQKESHLTLISVKKDANLEIAGCTLESSTGRALYC